MKLLKTVLMVIKNHIQPFWFEYEGCLKVFISAIAPPAKEKKGKKKVEKVAETVEEAAGDEPVGKFNIVKF